MRYLNAMFTGGCGDCDDFLYYFSNMKVYLAASVVCCLPFEKVWQRLSEKVAGWGETICITGLMLLVLTYVVSSTYNPFIYFNF